MKFAKLVIGGALTVAFGAAQAGQIFIGGDAGGPNGKMTTKAGVCSLTFNVSGSPLSGCSNVTATGLVAGSIVTGSSSGLYAAPAGDTSGYLTVSPAGLSSAASPVTFTVSSAANYFGFFAGSLDTYNLVEFLLGGVVVDSFTGTQINAVAFPGSPTTGNQAAAQYIDYFPTSSYTSVRISSTANAFELDNLAIGLATPAGVPEPESVALLGLGALALIASRRRKA